MSSTTTPLTISTEQEFAHAQKYIHEGPKPSGESSNETKLNFYAYFKQATTGPNISTKRPGMFDLVARAKYDAWKKLGDLSKEEAMKGYIRTLDSQSPNWRDWIKENVTAKSNGETPPIITSSPTSAQRNIPSSHSSLKPSVARRRPNRSVFAQDCLEGQVAIITGGGSGICKGIAESLMRHGCHTAIIARNFDRLQEAARELEKEVNNGTKCFPIASDVRDYSKLENAFDDILRNYGRIDILVNGAAGNFLCPTEQLSSNAFKTVMEIDTVGTFHASKLAFLKYMKEHGGSIINLSMTLHHQATPFQVHAGCAKSAIDAMTKHLAVEWGVKGVRVNAIAIGPINGTEGFFRLMPSKDLELLESKIPLQRWGEIQDIADAAVYLSSDAASYVTGSILTVDGGSVFTTGGFLYPDIVSRL